MTDLEELQMELDETKETLRLTLHSREYYIRELRVTEAHCEMLEDKIRELESEKL